MNNMLKAKDLTLEQFMSLPNQITRAEDAPALRCWFEAADGWAFDWWPGLKGEVLWCRTAANPSPLSATEIIRRSTAGRLFASDGELRWRTIPSLGPTPFRCVFLGQTDWFPNELDDMSAELGGLKPARKQYLLWGQQTDIAPDEWIELRIPHRFRYPIKNYAERVVLESEYWVDKTLQPHFVRFCDLHPYQESF